MVYVVIPNIFLYLTLPTSFSTCTKFSYFLSEILRKTEIIFSFLESCCFLTCLIMPRLELGKFIPFNALAIPDAEIFLDFKALLPPFLLGVSKLATLTAFLGRFPLFNSPKAIATSAESLQLRFGSELIRFKRSELVAEVLCVANWDNSSVVFGYLIPFSALWRSAADEALGG